MEPTPIPVSPAPKSASRGRILLYALMPLLLLALLTGAVRLVTDAERRQAALQDAPSPRREPPSPNTLRPAPRSPVLKPADPKTRAALETIVRGQLQAIATRDFTKALSFAVPPLRESTNPEGFRGVIENGYAPMLRMKRVEIADARVQTTVSGGKTAMVDVVVVTQSGEQAKYGYMLRFANAVWQVQGVMTRMTRPPNSTPGDTQGDVQENTEPPRRFSPTPVL